MMEMVEFKIDFDGLSSAIGVTNGIKKGMEDSEYVDSVIQGAYVDATEEFDRTLAASAGAGYLSHVYEYGTAGITAGPVRHGDPTKPDARLYMHTFTGTPFDREISFVFRDAATPNPQPTVARTGVPSGVLRKLSKRKYIFRQRAMIMELGTNVSIRPKNGKLLFVPFYGEDSESGTGRGYMMYPNGLTQPIVTTPGQNSAGTFTKFWATWWQGRGVEMISGQVDKDIKKDVYNAIRRQRYAAAKGRAVSAKVANPRAVAKKVEKEVAADIRTAGTSRKRKRK